MQKNEREIVIPETKFDVLEEALLKYESLDDVFKQMSLFLNELYHPTFIAFYADTKDFSPKVKYILNNSNKVQNISLYISERNDASVSSNSLYVHDSTTVSLPFKYLNNANAYLIMGTKESGKEYSEADVKSLIPILRILSRVMFHQEVLSSHKEKSSLQKAFSAYMSPELVQEMIDNPDVVKIGGEKRYLSVMFTDIQNFTVLSERMKPETLVRVLNMYLNEMSQVILSLGGTIDKFEGDAIVAFFGAPHTLKDHAVRCCLAAIRMKQMEKLLNEQLFREKLIDSPIFTRIGINTGDVIVGNIGSVLRMEYTIIGSTVNTAARIENINKQYNTSVLISGQTFRQAAPFFECEFVDATELKGISEKVAVYELKGIRDGKRLDYINFNNSITPEINADSEITELEEV